MERWIDTVAAAFGEAPLPAERIDELLDVARDVAHRTERRLTPVAAFLAGVGAGRARAGGAAQDAAIADALATLRGTLPAPSADGSGPAG